MIKRKPTGVRCRRYAPPAAAVCASRLVLALLLGVVWWPAEVVGQRPRSWDATSALRPALIERHAPIEHLLKTARQAIGRRDWKLAIDSLQRVLSDGAGVLLRPEVDEADDGALVVYGSARDEATAMLAELPPEGLSAYRVLHDGRAAGLWERARAEGDSAALRTVVEEYLLTSVGDDAAAWLVATLLDQGDAPAALHLLDRLETYCPDSDVPPRLRAYQRAAGQLMLGDVIAAEAALAALPVDTTDGRAAALRELIAGGWQSGPAGGGEESWPMAGGDLQRSGRMAAVSPELRENLPWRYAIPMDDPDWWERQYLPQRQVELGLPAAQPVAADGRVFVRGLRQTVALDVESLEPLWISQPTVEAALSTEAFRGRRWFVREASYADYTSRERLLHDYAGAALAVAGDLVFTIEREGGGEYTQAATDQVDRGEDLVDGLRRGARLVARAADSGLERWSRGRTLHPTDPLGGVYFLSAPIAIGDGLWTTYLRGGDLFVGVLAPADGALRRELLLCTIEAPQIEALVHEAIYPAKAGGLVYFSGGMGLALAVDADAFALRWAAQYPRWVNTDRALEPVNWLCGPPRISGRTLLLSPTDAQTLMALDRWTGALRWRQPRPAGVYYVLGVDDDRAWLAGERLLCVSLTDGREIWRAEQGDALEVTGRGALSGRRVFLPTVEGMAVFDADTGATLPAQPLPADQLPLGNLLCVASALFSMDTNEVRKFPDLTLSYPKQLARYQADPADAQTAARLAWMELLRDAPARAAEVAEAALADLPPGHRYLGLLGRVLVDAKLKLAKSPDMDAAQAIAHLQAAVQASTGDFDRLRATLALAARLRDTGQGDDAYLALWRLGLTSAGDGYVTIEPRLRNRARHVIAAVLAGFERKLTARQLQHIAEETQSVLRSALVELSNPATRATAEARLRQLAELDDAGGAGQAALVALGRTALEESQFERSGQYLRAAIRDGQVARTTAEALRDLAAQYLDPRQGLHAEAAALLDRLAEEFGGLPLAAADGSGAVVTAADEAARLRLLVDPAQILAARLAAGGRRFTLASSADGAPPAPLAPGVLFDVVSGDVATATQALVLGPSDAVQAIDPATGAPHWVTQLNLLGATRFDPVGGEPLPRQRAVEAMPPRAFCDGQIAVINGAGGLFGVGLITGRRLWGMPYEAQESADRTALRNRLVAVDRGRIVWAPRRGMLACAAVGDGRDLIWERILPDEKIDTVFLRDSYCVTLDNARRRATVYDADNGRMLSVIDVQQPDEDAPIPLLYERGHLLAPAGIRTVGCYNVRTGALNWGWEAAEEIRWTFRAGKGYVGVSTIAGEVTLFDLLTGDRKLTVRVPPETYGEVEGVVVGDALLLMPMIRTGGAANPALMSVALSDGSVRWRHKPFGAAGPTRFALWRLLRVADEVIPMLDCSDNPAFGVVGGDCRVELIDKADGQRVGPAASIGRAMTREERFTGEVAIRGSRLLVGAGRGVLAWPIVAAPDGGPDGVR